MKSCRNCPFQSEVYKDLTGEEFDEIDAHRYEVNYAPGEVILKQGTSCTHMLSFVSGMAKMYIETAQKGELLIRIIRPHEFIAGSGLYQDNKCLFSVKAVEPSMVCLLDISVIRKFLVDNPRFAVSMLNHFHQNMIFVMDRLLSFYTKQHIGRLAESLLYLAEDIYKTDSFELSLPKKDIAALAGISKENFQRLLKNLENDRIIRTNGRSITILNREKLRQISNNG